MKKQISVFALAAASVAIGMSSAHAQALPNVAFNPNTAINPPSAVGQTPVAVNATGNDAQIITVGGNIPEFIQFTTVNNNIALGNIGGPLWNSATQGPARSTQGRSGNSNSGPGFSGNDFVQSTDATPGAGEAKVEFRANTYIRVKFSGGTLTNTGPDLAVGGGDDYTLGTSYRLAVKGKVQFAAGPGNAGTGIYDSYPGGVGQNPAYAGDYASYSPPIDAANTTQVNMTYKPGAPTFTGAETSVPNNDPNASSGFRVMAEVNRNGLNDYRGAYNTTLNLTYFKY